MRCLLLLAALLVLAMPGVAAAQEVNVFTDDSPDGCTVGHCTLREKVDAAVDGTVINLAAGTYELTQGDLALDTDVSILGRGARLTTIDANRASRIGYVTGVVGVAGLTATGGDASVAGLRQGNGGAFFVDATGALTITQAALVDNIAFATGGAVSNEGAFTLTSSLAFNNRVQGNNPALGGAIWSIGTGTTVVNSTLSGNAALDIGGSATRGGGIYYADASRLEHVTITGNVAAEGAGLHAIAGSGSIAGSIVAGNAGPQCGGAMATVAERDNLAGDETCLFDRQAVDAGLGGLTDNGGPTNTHALLAGSPAIDGVPAAFCPVADQRLIARAAGACDIGAFDTGFTPQPPPPPPVEEAPVAGESVLVEPSGTVKIKRPGATRFVRLREGDLLPVGTVVDTLKGRVTLTAAGGQTAVFYDGVFRVTQGRGARPLTTLTLVERLRCGGRASAAAKAKKKRRLWGDGSGRFRTKGKHSAATVVGTKWLVEDTCSTTLTRVVRGRVSVRDFVKRKTVLVKAGKRYIARARKR